MIKTFQFLGETFVYTDECTEAVDGFPVIFDRQGLVTLDTILEIDWGGVTYVLSGAELYLYAQNLNLKEGNGNADCTAAL